MTVERPKTASTSFASPQSATHWLFTRLEGLVDVAIPETAVFDSEGVFERWLYTDPSPHSAQASKRCTIRTHSYLQLNLLRLEARLQVRTLVSHFL